MPSRSSLSQEKLIQSRHTRTYSFNHTTKRNRKMEKSTMVRGIKQEDDDVLLEDTPMDDVFGIDDDEEEEDLVVREINVYLSPALNEQLYMLQFPLQQEGQRAAQPTEARIKPRQSMIELDQQTSNKIERNGSFSNMSVRTLVSQTIPVQTHLCLGKLVEGSLHLVPLGHVSQMRPSFRHVDAKDNPDPDDADEDFVGGDKNKEKKPVVFQRKESERAAMARKSSYAFKKASEEAEEWRTLTVKDDDTYTQQIIEKVVCPTPEQSVLQQLTADSPSYVGSLNYIVPDEGAAVDPSLSYGGATDLKSVVARVTQLMARSASPIPFSLLCLHFNNISNDMLFTALSTCSVMVRGNFCLNSKFIPCLPKHLQRARTFVLLLLQSIGTIQRIRLDKCFLDGISSERLMLILKQVAALVPGRACWQLKICDDFNFQTKFPEQVALHNGYWERQQVRFAKELARYGSLTKVEE
jgi:DNA-directed RNA polymerase-3 subunit RPC5